MMPRQPKRPPNLAGPLLGLFLATGLPLPAQEKPAGGSPAPTFAEQLQAGKLACPLDPLAAIPGVWNLTPDQLDAAFPLPKGAQMKKNPYFQWMTRSRERAVFMKQPYSNLALAMSLFGGELPVEEVIVDFKDGKLNGVTFSLYNKGDSGAITPDEFQRRLKFCGKKLGEMLAVRPAPRKSDPAQGLLAEGWTWLSPAGMAALEHNPEATTGNVEFLRLKIAPRDSKGAFAAAIQGRSVAVKLSDLPKNVTRLPNGDVVLQGIPMVDQGPKGYCVVASAQRLFEYYGIPADQHQIAQVVGTDAKAGTSSVAMAEALGKIDYRFKTRFKIIAMSSETGLVEVDPREMTVGKPVSQEQFSKAIYQYIDNGVPLLWGLMLGMHPEEPSIAQQVGGGHMRMVIGYNDKTGHLLFSDSWGAGHELKRMTLAHAYSATQGLFAMSPTVR